MSSEIFLYDDSENLIAYGGIGKESRLSNFYNYIFIYNGIVFISSEQAIQYEKAKLFGDEEASEKILQAKTPFGAKRLGSKVKNFDDEKWFSYLTDSKILYNILLAKFRSPEMKDWLINTQQAFLAEITKTKNGIVTYSNKRWGIEIHVNHPNVGNVEAWQSSGYNLLGKTLMILRTDLMK
jgi:ribA/ribD-fused uncharacterized protein